LLARALAADPALLLLDEPTAHIDPAAESRMWALLRQMTPARTVVVVSHDPALLIAHADRIALLNGTLRVIAPDELDAPTLQWAYSRHPEIPPPARPLRGAAG
jgi:ABC-type Mn2+/Zn2+ transport system ATPase subunit